jgi:ABC-type transport system involved in Fe-S cluster assembly fused permease/ATPase subunit
MSTFRRKGISSSVRESCPSMRMRPSPGWKLWNM